MALAPAQLPNKGWQVAEDQRLSKQILGTTRNGATGGFTPTVEDSPHTAEDSPHRIVILVII